VGIIPSEFWYIWFTLAHCTYGTPAGTLSVLRVDLIAVFKTVKGLDKTDMNIFFRRATGVCRGYSEKWQRVLYARCSKIFFLAIQKLNIVTTGMH